MNYVTKRLLLTSGRLFTVWEKNNVCHVVFDYKCTAVALQRASKWNNRCPFQQCRYFSQITKCHNCFYRTQSPSRRYASTKKSSEGKKAIVESEEQPDAGLTVGEKVKEAGKDATYTGVIILGVGITGIMFYTIGRELFSKQSPSGIFGDALKLCQKDEQLNNMLGQPMRGYGEMTRRGRRRYASHQEYMVGDVRHMRMKFYVEGPHHKKATVNLEAKQNEKGKYEYRYIVAELDGYPRRTVLVVDNT